MVATPVFYTEEQAYEVARKLKAHTTAELRKGVRPSRVFAVEHDKALRASPRSESDLWKSGKMYAVHSYIRKGANLANAGWIKLVGAESKAAASKTTEQPKRSEKHSTEPATTARPSSAPPSPPANA